MWAALDRTGHPNLDVRRPMRKVAGANYAHDRRHGWVQHPLRLGLGDQREVSLDHLVEQRLARQQTFSFGPADEAVVSAWRLRRCCWYSRQVRATITMLKMVSPMTPGSGSARSGRAGR